MTGHERILTALRHLETGTSPVDFAASRVTGIHALTYNRLACHLGVRNAGTRVYDLPQMLAEPEGAILERIPRDVVQLHRLPGPEELGARLQLRRRVGASIHRTLA